MEARKCDRCRKYYDNYTKEIPEGFENSHEAKGNKINGVILYGIDNMEHRGMPIGSSKYIDLCPECMDGLIRYIKGDKDGEPTDKSSKDDMQKH